MRLVLCTVGKFSIMYESTRNLRHREIYPTPWVLEVYVNLSQ